LSIGERRRVALAHALLARPALLALDEPTNHLDARTTAWLEERLIERDGALLLVTHDRYFLDRVATRIFELDRGSIYTYEGGYARFLEKQAERLGEEARRERERAAFVRRELDWIRRGPAARTTKQKARIDRFDAAVAQKPQAADRAAGPPLLQLPMTQRLGKSILELRGLTKSAGGKDLFSDLTLTWKAGDRIGVVGPNGAGKTTLVRTILGRAQPDAGEVVVGQNTSFAFLDQGRADLRDDKTVLEEVAGDNDRVFLPEGPVHARTFLRMMLFDDGFADTPVGTLSGGERNRVQLAKLLRAGGNFLVLDEPTNDLDLMTLGVLEEALASFPGCALIVSHDRWFLDRVATGILAFEGDGRVGFYEGSCSDYLARKRNAPVDAAPSPARAERDTRPERQRPRKVTFKEKQELAGMEQAIVDAESRVAELERTLQDPSIYQTRGAEVPALVAALDEAKREVERLYARWQELEAIAAAAAAAAEGNS
jgi:ATP-binding cassette subfamily F protein uup